MGPIVCQSNTFDPRLFQNAPIENRTFPIVNSNQSLFQTAPTFSQPSTKTEPIVSPGSLPIVNQAVPIVTPNTSSLQTVPTVHQQSKISAPKPQKYKKDDNFSRFVKRFKQYVLLRNISDLNMNLLFLGVYRS